MSAKRGINAVLVYDGECGPCTRWAKKVENMRRPPNVVAWQDVEDLNALGLTARQVHEAVQWVEFGRNESGARAVGRLMRFQGRGWPLIAWMPFVWPFSEMAAAMYRFAARHRGNLPGLR